MAEGVDKQLPACPTKGIPVLFVAAAGKLASPESSKKRKTFFAPVWILLPPNCYIRGVSSRRHYFHCHSALSHPHRRKDFLSIFLVLPLSIRVLSKFNDKEAL